MVKKANGKWTICVDFIDLCKACPKDYLSLLSIDTFMDVFSVYNQIFMHSGDQEKTSFITEHGIYCYKVMPFGLKNVRATY